MGPPLGCPDRPGVGKRCAGGGGDAPAGFREPGPEAPAARSARRRNRRGVAGTIHGQSVTHVHSVGDDVFRVDAAREVNFLGITPLRSAHPEISRTSDRSGPADHVRDLLPRPAVNQRTAPFTPARRNRANSTRTIPSTAGGAQDAAVPRQHQIGPLPSAPPRISSRFSVMKMPAPSRLHSSNIVQPTGLVPHDRKGADIYQNCRPTHFRDTVDPNIPAPQFCVTCITIDLQIGLGSTFARRTLNSR
ncbi:hypothetical protein GA0115240_159029 [Streptomyces sp. DvalAA-14]|nr:hypothetical protein GA0115240_159029 [Streptomyces sp. DvalAA-14]